MKQYDAVEKISKAIIADNLVEAVFLKGSLARGTEDEYSNVDLYVITSEENYDKFLDKRLKYLQSYKNIIYHNFIYYRYQQAICIFENGLHFNLYTCLLKDIGMVDDIVVINDPKGFLSNYKKIPLSYNPSEIGSLLDNLCLSSLEYYNSYNRGDYIYSFHLSSHLFSYLGTFLRIKYDPDFAKLGIKQFTKVLDVNVRDRYFEIAKKLKLDSQLECVKMMYVLLDNYINNLPIKIAEHINFDFYVFTKMKIMSIN